MDGLHVSHMGAGIQSLRHLVSGIRGRQIQTLCLHANSISKIEGLQMLPDLRELNLSSNAISEMEGLQTLTSLTSLNLASNRISSIDKLHNLSSSSLQHLNLSHNCIAHLSGLAALQVYLPMKLSPHTITIDPEDQSFAVAPQFTGVRTQEISK